MFKRFFPQRGQAIGAEYVVVTFVAIGAVMAMSVFVRRAIQARVHDAQVYTTSQASNALGRPIPVEYEPYYAEMISNTAQNATDRTRFVGGNSYRKVIEQEKHVASQSLQLPPKQAN